MQSFVEVNVHDFEAALTPDELRTFQIIQGALGAGVATLLCAPIILYGLNASVPASEATSGVQLVHILSLVHIALAVALGVAGHVVYSILFRPAALASATRTTSHHTPNDSTHDPARHCVALCRTATIVRLALYEGIAMFGLVVCVLAALNGVLRIYPIYWLNAASSVAFLGYIVLTFPTTERLKAQFRRHMTRMVA